MTMRQFSKTRRSFGLILLYSVLLSLIACGTAAAQSGRRPPKAVSQPEQPAPAAQIEKKSPPPVTSAGRPLPATTLLVAGRFKQQHSADRAQTIFLKFVERLSEPSTMKVTSLGVLKREAVVKRAQAEMTAYVVWLELETDNVQEGRVIINSPDLVIKYSVFAPRTGQVKTKGKVYYQTMGGPKIRRGGQWPSGTPIKITAEAAGIEAAERVLDWLSFNNPQP